MLHDNQFWIDRLHMQQDPCRDIDLMEGYPAEQCPYSELEPQDIGYFLEAFPVLMPNMKTISIGTSGKHANDECTPGVLALSVD